MEHERFFCSLAARDRAEPLYGTVARIQSWLLLEYPGAWRKHAIEDSRLLSEPVKHHLCRDFDRSLFIRREHIRSGPLHCFHVDACATPPRMTRTLLSSYEDMLQANEQADLVHHLVYAICTHGKHDKCCAKFGLPLFCAFRDLIGERAWQCSHVGGDRFAANVIVFPHGLYYGHVEPDEAPELVRRSEAGEVWLARYRGRSCFPRPVQVAEYFVRAESGRMGIDEFQPLGVQRQPDGTTSVRFHARSDGSEHRIEFITSTPPQRELLTCGSTEPSLIPRYHLKRYLG